MNPVLDIPLPFASADADLAKNVGLCLNGIRGGFQRIGVSASGGTVKLTGFVGSFYLRQLAVETTKHVAGVRHVLDDLEVDPE
jgi:osmotically-inducible protein OsmY